MSDKDKQALTAVRQSLKNIVLGRKNAVVDRLKELQEKLKILKQLSGDPKIVASQVKQIIKELRAAAQQYADAVKSEGGGDASPTGDPFADTAASGDAAPPTAGATGDDATAQAGAAANANAGTDPSASAPSGATANEAKASTNAVAESSSSAAAAGSAVPAGGASASSDASAASPADSIGSTGKPAQGASPGAPATTDQATQPAAGAVTSADGKRPADAAQAYKDAAAKDKAKSDEAEADKGISTWIKDLGEIAKSLLNNAARKLKAKHPNDQTMAEAKGLEKGLDEDIQNLNKVLDSSGGGSGSAIVTVGEDNATAAPNPSTSSAVNLVA